MIGGGSVRSALQTDVGRREHNEDAGAVIVAEPAAGWGFDVALIVCDGVGGSARGEVASARTVARLEAELRASSARPIGERIRAAVAAADAEIREQSERELGGAQMGTTVVVGVVHGRTLTIAHAGDSRAYLVRGGALEQLTADHSIVAEQVRQGIIPASAARTHPLRSRITRAVGLGEDARVDVRDVPLRSDDVVLLCSDGLYTAIGDGEIVKAVDRDLDASAHRLIALANKNGGKDNVTVALCRVD